MSNALARRHLRAMSEGDPVLIYHTGGQRDIVALARVKVAIDPNAADGSERKEVMLAFDRLLIAPIPLDAIKADPHFADFALVRIGRLSVMPVTIQQWRRIMEMEKEISQTPMGGSTGTKPAARKKSSASRVTEGKRTKSAKGSRVAKKAPKRKR